ncbi:uncharacterized protein LOC120088978 [Benincasa hispida]|uniref:uncharacterized protein LOC120088978 n=1 Tax=Benincasa hispida TaxID=102211 RepID=UPI001900D8E5|nr:uncharacterized protein LOC120088978 [Benincasa hispida]
MIDTKLVVNHIEELQIIINDLQCEGLVISEPFQVVVVIEKLAHSWKDFKCYLKHKRKELSMENFVAKLYIEEDNRKGDKTPLEVEAKAHITEVNLRSRISSRKMRIMGQGMMLASAFEHKKGQSSNNQANVKENDDLVAVIYEVNMASDTKGWWIDTDATRHICRDKSLFITYEKLDGSDKLYKENASTASMESKGKVMLKWIFGKILTLNDI